MSVLERPRVLCIEDDAESASLLQSHLESAHFDVMMAHDGKDGVAKYANNAFDVVLIAQQLPVMLEVVRHLTGQGDAAPIILLAEAGDEERAIEAMRFGVSDTLVKDPDGSHLKKLPSVIHRVLRERELTRARHQAELALELERERSKLLATFLEQASHEFRTPLTVIISSLGLLERALSDEKALKRLDLIKLQAEGILELVNDLLALAMLDSEGPLETRRVDINPLLEDCVSRFDSQAVAQHITVVRDFSPSVLFVDVNADKFVKALSELIDNALRFTEPDSSVTIRSDKRDGHVIVEVIDQGIGIAPDDMPHIFERFYRVDKAHSTRGFGLGLPLVSGIVRLHQADITLESALGEGTLVRLTFLEA